MPTPPYGEWLMIGLEHESPPSVQVQGELPGAGSHERVWMASYKVGHPCGGRHVGEPGSQPPRCVLP